MWRKMHGEYVTVKQNEQEQAYNTTKKTDLFGREDRRKQKEK